MHCSQGQKKTSVYDGIDLEIQMFNEDGQGPFKGRGRHNNPAGWRSSQTFSLGEDDGIYEDNEVVDD